MIIFTWIMSEQKPRPSDTPGSKENSALSNRLIPFWVQLLSGQGARAGYLSAIEQGIISISNFFATLLLARNVSPTELGVYGVGFTALRLIRSIQDGLTIQPINTYGPAIDENNFRRYATSTALLQLSLALVSAAGAALLGWVLIQTGNDTAGPGVFSLWPAFLWWQLQEFLRRVLYTRGRVLEASLNTILANIARLVWMFFCIQNGSITGIAGIQAIAYGSLIALIPGIWQTRMYITRKPGDILQDWKHNWDFGRWVLGSSIANWVAIEFYPVLTAGMINFAATGAYRAIQNLVAPIHLILRAMDTFLTPRAAKAYQESGLPALRRMLRLSYLVSAAPVLGLLGLAILFPRPLLKLLYGEVYLEYSNAIIWMAIFYGLWFIYWPLQTALKAARLSRPIFIANTAAIAAMFTIGIGMIIRWGVYGTIAGQALNSLIVAVILWLAWKSIPHEG